MTLFPTLRGVNWRRDLIAALTLAALALPEQLATARLAGLPAAQGIAVFAAASLVMVLVARDRALSVGADSSIAPVIAAALAASAAPGSAALIALLVGLILCLVAALRLEAFARLLSLPVAAGMMAGIAIHIFVGRLPTALGLDIEAASPVKTFGAVWAGMDAARIEALALTCLVTALCLAGRAWSRRFPAPLFALALAALLAQWMDPEAALLARSTEIGEGWELAPAILRPEAALQALPAALVVAFLCLFQTTVVLRQGGGDAAADRRNAIGAVGLANLAAAGIGGFAVNSSPPRTQILRDAGATGQLAGLGAAAISLAVLMLAPDLLALLPAAALAGVLVFVAIHIFPFGTFMRLVGKDPVEAAIAFAAMVLVTGLPLQSGLPLAILLSLIHATLPLFSERVVELSQQPGATVWWNRPQTAPEARRDDLLVLGLTSPLNFANAEGVIAAIRVAVAGRERAPKLLVLECAGLLSLDATAAETLIALIAEMRAAGIALSLARVESARARAQLARCGVLDILGPERMFDSVAEAVGAHDAP